MPLAIAYPQKSPTTLLYMEVREVESVEGSCCVGGRLLGSLPDGMPDGMPEGSEIVDRSRSEWHVRWKSCARLRWTRTVSWVMFVDWARDSLASFTSMSTCMEWGVDES